MISKGLFTWRWGTLGRWGNPPVHINSYHVSAIKLIWEIIWTGRLPHLSGLPHLTGAPYLHVNRPYSVFAFLAYSAVQSNLPWAWYLWSQIWFGTLESGTHTRIYCFSSALVFMFPSLSIVMHRYVLLSMLFYLVILSISDSGGMKHNPLEVVGHLLCDRWSHMEVPL